ncbi:MAG: hypothetical protein CW694_06665 [Candidatus Syntrophoarchaeum sp. WYZ-LMO15]|nr:MAG: hypothetical protein CW694_06665 [Candidatus Syntrophoarchaeum sp. WYZ-LMO15]
MFYLKLVEQYCIVPKNLTLNTLTQLMGYGRLTGRKVRYIVRHKQRGKQVMTGAEIDRIEGKVHREAQAEGKEQLRESHSR